MSILKPCLRLSSQSLVDRYLSVFTQLQRLKLFKHWQVLNWDHNNIPLVVLAVEYDHNANHRVSPEKCFSLFEQVLLEADLAADVAVPLLLPVQDITKWQAPLFQQHHEENLQHVGEFATKHFPALMALGQQNTKEDEIKDKGAGKNKNTNKDERENEKASDASNRRKPSWAMFKQSPKETDSWYLQDEVGLIAIHPVYIALLSNLITLDKYQQHDQKDASPTPLQAGFYSYIPTCISGHNHRAELSTPSQTELDPTRTIFTFDRDLPLTVFQWLDKLRVDIYQQRLLLYYAAYQKTASGQTTSHLPLMNGVHYNIFHFFEQSTPFEDTVISKAFEAIQNKKSVIFSCGVNLAMVCNKQTSSLHSKTIFGQSGKKLTDNLNITLFWQLDMSRFSMDFPANLHESFLMVNRAVCRYPKQLVAALFSRNDLNDALFLPHSPLRNPKKISQLPISKFEHYALKQPHHIAVSEMLSDPNEASHQSKKHYNYAELNQAANQLGRLLLDRITRNNNPSGKTRTPFTQAHVLVLMPVSYCSVMAAVATAKINGIYIPLDPDYPVERLQAMIKGLPIDAILHSDSLAFVARRLIRGLVRGHSQELSQKLINLDSDKTRVELSEYHSQNLPVTSINRANPAQNGGFSTAYLMFTSGSTGQPKGVSGALLSIANRVDWFAQVVGDSDNKTGQTYAASSSVSFVDHIADYWQPLATGNTIGVTSSAQSRNIHQLIAQLRALNVAYVSVLPSTLSQLITHPDFARIHSLQVIVTSGEPLTTGLAEQVHMLCQGRVRLINIYGTTESGADAAWHEVPYLPHYSVMRYFQSPAGLTGNSAHSLSLATQSDTGFTQADVELESLVSQFSSVAVPEQPQAFDAFIESLQAHIFPHLIDVSSSKYIGHMTSALPDFMATLNQVITSANQNLVKIETSKVLTLVERQVLAKMHKLFYQHSDEYYQQRVQDPKHMFGTITSGGSLANVTALYCARNKGLLQRGITKDQLQQRGAIQCVQDCGFSRSVILVSRLAHYSIRKTAGLLGLGEDNLIIIEQDNKQRLNTAQLQQVIRECQQKQYFIIAVIGIAGATETGTVDPLPEMATVARAHHIHFHVDAAWGGAFMLSKDFAYKLNGIEQADSITFCAHKQLYLAQGISMCLMRDSQALNAIATYAEYQAAAGSFDLGQYSLEGSRPAVSLMLHGALNLFGQSGYSWLIAQSMQKAAYIREVVAACPAMELVGENDLNIINYRYIPAELRQQPTPYSADQQQQISQATDAIQAQQFLAGKTFVSRTKIIYTPVSDEKISVFRVVPINPLTGFSDIIDVLNEQLTIANTIIEHAPVNTEMHATAKLANSPLVPIGKPVQNVGVFILDAFLKPPPCGVPGDIYITGMALAEGYYNDDELTDERFMSNPFAQSNLDKRMYKTGDTGLINHRGEIEFCGRADRQVKINGNRVELAAMVNVLAQQDRVESVHIVPVSGESLLVEANIQQSSSDQLSAQLSAQLVDTLVAIVQTSETVAQGTGSHSSSYNNTHSQQHSIEQQALIARLNEALQRLPADHQVSQWVFVSRIPVLPNGKVHLLQCEQLARRALLKAIDEHRSFPDI